MQSEIPNTDVVSTGFQQYLQKRHATNTSDNTYLQNTIHEADCLAQPRIDYNLTLKLQ